MEAIFNRQQRLLPDAGDLSFYDWAKQTSKATPTETFEILYYPHTSAMMLKCRQDGYLIDLDLSSQRKSRGSKACEVLSTPEYQQVVLFDHVLSGEVALNE